VAPSIDLSSIACWLGGVLFGMAAERIHLWAVARKRSLRDYAIIKRTLDDHTFILARIEGAVKRREKR